MADLKELEQLKQKVEDLQEEAAKAQGAWEQAMISLEEEFDCKDLKKAKVLLLELEKKEQIAEEKFDRALAKFKEEWEVER